MAALDYSGTYELTKILPNGGDDDSAVPLPSTFRLQVIPRNNNNEEPWSPSTAKYGLNIVVANSLNTNLTVMMPEVAEPNGEPQAATVDGVRSTRMLAPPEKRKVEEALNRMLPNTNRIAYSRDTRQLVLLQHDNHGRIEFLKNELAVE